MNRCKQCKIQIADDAMVCPLCNSVLEIEKQGKKEETMYPDIAMRTRIFRKIVRAYFVIAVLLEILLVVINTLTFSGIWWSVICGAAFLYLFLTLNFSISNHNHGHMLKITVQAIGVVLLAFLIDRTIGYKGWSLNYVMPSVMILVDVAIMILMIANSVNWQAYLSLQLTMVIFGVLGIVFCLVNVINKPILMFISAMLSFVLFLGTLLIGDKKAKNELKRRFHV
ncbi:MAG: zinc ribbon domain-containing protein [Lachnospiraceae bacterium]|nr:zinc ribbon domain-containing protein [Lachnospiraceae bacterium]